MENPSEKPAALASLAEPQRIGRYTVIKTLGRGGMGEVLKAVDDDKNRYVAIKVLDPAVVEDPEVLKRFEREARSAMALDHPSIAKMYGMEHDKRGQPFIVMEFIDGVPLDKYLQTAEDPPYSQLVDFVIQTARGLESAHRRSIIHRDVKPSNLIVMNDLRIRIIDFGLAKSLWDRSVVTATGIVVGTPRYISPEQALGRTVDHRSDIYSLGATFYELVTRQTPFDGDTAMGIMLKHINAPLLPPYMINPKVPGDVNEIICRMMAKDPKDRYQDYEPLIRDLEAAKIHRLAKERRIDENDPLDVANTVAEAPKTVLINQPARSPYMSEGLVDVDFSELPSVKPHKSPARMLAFSAVGVLLVLGAVFALMQTEEQPDQPSSWLGERIRTLMQDDQAPATPAPADLAAKDREMVNLTLQRMQATVQQIIEYRKRPRNTGAFPTIRQLRGEGVLTIDQTQDAWQNDFVVSSANGGTLTAPGRSQDDTADDFVMTLTGEVLQSPTALTPEDFAQK